MIGHGSKSDVRINSVNTGVEKESAHSSAKNLLITRIMALVLGVVGILVAVALFLRLAVNIDPFTILLLVLAALIAVLGMIGTLKPESVYQLFKGMIDHK